MTISSGELEDQLEVVKLLIVDDREEDLEAMCLILTDPGYDLVTVRSSAEALKRLLQDDFAVILLDVMLPGLDGFEVARLVQQRERSRHTPILFLTAMGSDLDYIYRAYSAGAVDYLVKPIAPDVVRAKVAVFANLFRKDRRIRRQAEALREAQRRQQELELAELRRSNEKRYRNLADAIPAIVWTARPDGQLQYANRAWYLFTGLDKEATRGGGWLRAVHPDDRAAVERGWLDAVARRQIFAMECRLKSGKGGGYRAHIVHAIPEVEADGQMVGWLGTMSDCEDLRQAISARDQFLATASHELRTPLYTLELVTESLQRMLAQAPPGAAGDLGQRLTQKLEVSARQVDRLSRLVSALLDVTRIANGRAVLEREVCDLADVVRDVVQRLGEEARRAGSELELRAITPAVGWFDPLRVDQVVTNLVSNAIRYGGGQPIQVALEKEGRVVRILVEDRGCGIAPEHLDRLFGRFQRFHAVSAPGGLGLGLYISRHIARAHGGDIHVRSEPGKGSCFTVELPGEVPPDSSSDDAGGQ